MGVRWLPRHERRLEEKDLNPEGRLSILAVEVAERMGRSKRLADIRDFLTKS